MKHTNKFLPPSLFFSFKVALSTNSLKGNSHPNDYRPCFGSKTSTLLSAALVTSNLKVINFILNYNIFLRHVRLLSNDVEQHLESMWSLRMSTRL